VIVYLPGTDIAVPTPVVWNSSMTRGAYYVLATATTYTTATAAILVAVADVMLYTSCLPTCTRYLGLVIPPSLLLLCKRCHSVHEFGHDSVREFIAQITEIKYLCRTECSVLALWHAHMQVISLGAESVVWPKMPSFHHSVWNF
jgi:hypothetical protein